MDCAGNRDFIIASAHCDGQNVKRRPSGQRRRGRLDTPALASQDVAPFLVSLSRPVWFIIQNTNDLWAVDMTLNPLAMSALYIHFKTCFISPDLLSHILGPVPRVHETCYPTVCSS